MGSPATRRRSIPSRKSSNATRWTASKSCAASASASDWRMDNGFVCCAPWTNTNPRAQTSAGPSAMNWIKKMANLSELGSKQFLCNAISPVTMLLGGRVYSQLLRRRTSSRRRSSSRWRNCKRTLLNATKTSRLALRSNSRKMESIWLLKVQTRNHMKFHL